MKKFLVFFLLILFTSTCLAQKQASIKGVIADSATRSLLDYATVAVVNANDTTLISYTVTKKDGTFRLTGIPTTTKVKLIISYIGYQTYRQLLDLEAGTAADLGLITLTRRSLNEVIIRGEKSPLSIRKDTIEFNAEAFKTRPNAVVEELLRLLPGVQVNSNGAIFVNGKATSKVLIDGKEFFGTNQLVAIKNLDADIIDKVQVYADREKDPDHKINDINLQNIVNLKLKNQIKKNTIGKVMGAVGTRDRYEASGILSSFRDTLQFSIMGAANNLNSTGFSQDELYSMGGFNRSGTDQVSEGNFGRRQTGGFVNVKSGGININNNYGKKLKLNLAYFYGNTINDNNTKNLIDQTLESTQITSLKTDDYQYNIATHSLGGLIEWKPDTLNSFRYRPALAFSPQKNTYSSFLKIFNTHNPRVSESAGNIKGKIINEVFSHDFTYYRRFKKGKSLTLNHVLAINSMEINEHNFNELTSYTSNINSRLFDRYTNNNKKNNSAGIWVVYNLPLTKKITAELFSNSRYLNSSETLYAFDKNEQSGTYDKYLAMQSTDLTRVGFFQNLKPLINYQINKNLRIRIALDLEFQYVLNKFNTTIDNIDQRFLFLFPSMSIDYVGLSLSYTEWIDHPLIYNMQPIAREISPLSTFVGNPRLKPSKQHQSRANYYKYVPGKNIGMNAFVNLIVKDDNFVEKTGIEPNGASTTTVINKDGAVWANVGGSINKQLEKSQKLQIKTSTTVNAVYNKYVVFLNSDEGKQISYSLNLSQDLNFNYRSIVLINANYYISKSLVSYNDLNYNSFSTYSHQVGATGLIRLPKKIILDAKYSYIYNPQVALGFPRSSHIINMAVSLLMLHKDRGQLKLSIYDLLNENVSVNRYAQVNAVVTNEQSILKRYIMINYQYKFNIFKGNSSITK